MSHPSVKYMESLGEMRLRIETGVIPARPVVYKEITFRSKLERRYAIYLDDIGERWTYEPCFFGSRGTGYLPDFQLTDASKPTFIEVKPTLAEAPAAQQKMSVIWKSLPNAVLIVMCEEGCTYYAATLGMPWVEWQERWAA